MTEQDQIEHNENGKNKAKHSFWWWIFFPTRWILDTLVGRPLDIDGLVLWLTGHDEPFKWRWIMFWGSLMLGSIGIMGYYAGHFHCPYFLSIAFWPIASLFTTYMCRKSAVMWRLRAEAVREIARDGMSIMNNITETMSGYLDTTKDDLEALQVKINATSQDDRFEEALIEISSIREEVLSLYNNLARMNGILPPTLATLRGHIEKMIADYEQQIATLQQELALERGQIGIAEFFKGTTKREYTIARYQLFLETENENRGATRQMIADMALDKAKELIQSLSPKELGENDLNRKIRARYGKDYFSVEDIDHYHQALDDQMGKR